MIGGENYEGYSKGENNPKNIWQETFRQRKLFGNLQEVPANDLLRLAVICMTRTIIVSLSCVPLLLRYEVEEVHMINLYMIGVR